MSKTNCSASLQPVRRLARDLTCVKTTPNTESIACKEEVCAYRVSTREDEVESPDISQLFVVVPSIRSRWRDGATGDDEVDEDASYRLSVLPFESAPFSIPFHCCCLFRLFIRCRCCPKPWLVQGRKTIYTTHTLVPLSTHACDRLGLTQSKTQINRFRMTKAQNGHNGWKRK